MSKDLKEKLGLLEQSLLNLSTQLLSLQLKYKESQQFKKEFLKTIEGLKALLHEKGIVHKDDFENEIDLQHAIKELSPELVDEVDQKIQKRKIAVH